MSSRWVLPVLALGLAVALAGCGRKGPLEPPGGAPATSAVPTVFGTTPSRPPAAEPPQLDEPFVLDVLI